MNMFNFLVNPKKDITNYLDIYFSEKEKQFEKINRWGSDLIRKYLDNFKRGKLIRGSIVVWSHDAYGGALRDDAVTAGAALELFQSAILIHDDIIDNDYKRRGKKSIFAEYEEKGRKANIKKYSDFGKGMAICAADIGFFLVHEIISRIKNRDLSIKLLEIMSLEFSNVCLGEMQDIYMGMSDKEFSEKEILDMYRYKTARYSFSLPLVAGCILSEKTDDLDVLKKIGELMGYIYQTTDDYLGIFGKTSVIHKPVGNDITENKKTLFRYHLHKLLKSYDVIQKLFGKKITHSELVKLRAKIRKEGIVEKINARIKAWENEVLSLTSSLHLSKERKNDLIILMHWLRNRES